tara:strand:- start:167 stop:691 length:525 start_codon:yes stop_codon:yes gene_type:complete
MELLEWLQLLNVNEKALLTARSANNLIFTGYLVVFLIDKKAVFFAAFFVSVAMVEALPFECLKEWHIYSLALVIYSYVFNECPDDKSKLACVTICLLSFLFAIDAFLYGVNGYHGEYQTLIWQNIEYLATCAHIVFISTLVPYKRIRNGICNFIDFISSFSRDSAYLLYYWYND